MHEASREDFPRAPQILSAALIRVPPNVFILKAIVFKLRYVNMNIHPPPLTIASSYDLDIMSYVQFTSDHTCGPIL